jgi:glycosyltransferase involved in cell wall biosynthesis
VAAFSGIRSTSRLTTGRDRKRPIDCNLYYSSSVEGEMEKMLGVAHYSYRFAEAKFVATLGDQGLVPHKLVMPEFYASVEALPEGVHERGFADIHFMFRSTEQFRLLKFARNVSCFAWEFDVLKDSTLEGEHPFLNQTRMLGLCDEIWVPCSYTRSILRSYGLENVHTIPAPITVEERARPSLRECLSFVGHCVVAPLHYNAFLPREQLKREIAARAVTLAKHIGGRIGRGQSPRIYLSVLNPEDFRKNLDALLRGFHYFSREHSDALLLVKVLTSSSRYDLWDIVANVVSNKLDAGSGMESANILFFSDFLADEAMAHLYSMADFYLCPSLCEGQNLPLLEAMAHGAVPVSTANTAMGDYINAGNAVVIEDLLVPNDIPYLAATATGKPFNIRRSTPRDVCAALEVSAGLTKDRYAQMSAQSRDAVRVRFSPHAVWPLIERRLQALVSHQEQP